MQHTYVVTLKPSKGRSKRFIQEFVARHSGAETNCDDGVFCDVTADNEVAQRQLLVAARRAGIEGWIRVRTRYEPSDALVGDLGILHLGYRNSTKFKVSAPKDQFDFSTGCVRCGLGAARVRPFVLSGIKPAAGARFHFGHDGTNGVFFRTEIGRRIEKATGQLGCMRHPVTRSGDLITDWLEPVPCATLSCLSPNSGGVRFGSTSAMSDFGEPPREVPPCEACGRSIWSETYEDPLRLVYPRHTVAAAQAFAVVSMYEPKDVFPGFDPANRRVNDLYGLPWLLFNRKAIEVIQEFLREEDYENLAWIQPVFAE